LPETAEKSAQKHIPSFPSCKINTCKLEVSTDLIALLTNEITQPVINVLVCKKNLKIMEEYGVMEYLRADSK